MLRRPSPSTRRKLPTSFLIYTLKIRNRRNSRRITDLHFSNLYKSWASFLSDYPSSSSPSAPLRWAPSCFSSRVAAPGSWGLIYGSGIRTRMRQASSSRASIASRGIPPPPTREHRAKLQRTLIYGNGINSSRKLLKTKDRAHA